MNSTIEFQIDIGFAPHVLTEEDPELFGEILSNNSYKHLNTNIIIITQ